MVRYSLVFGLPGLTPAYSRGFSPHKAEGIRAITKLPSYSFA